MYIKFADVTGTTRLKLTIDGTQHTVNVFSTKTASVPENVGEHLLESDEYAVTPYDPDE